MSPLEPLPEELTLALAQVAATVRDQRCVVASPGFLPCGPGFHSSGCWDVFWTQPLPEIRFF